MRTMIKYSILIVVFSIVMSQNAVSQRTDTLVTVWITNVERPAPDELQFDLLLASNSEELIYWANGTFDIAFASGFVIDPTTVSLSLEAVQDVIYQPLAGDPIPTDTYYMTPRIFPGRFSITIVGPELYVDTYPILPYDTLRLGRFSVKTTDGTNLTSNFMWLNPIYYYQALAYKLDKPLILPPSNILAEVNHNIEFSDINTLYTAEYKAQDIDKPEFILDYFNVEYIGKMVMQIDFATIQEAYNYGFIITRAYKYRSTDDEATLDYKDTIAHYRIGHNRYNPDLVGLGTRKPGKVYATLYDTVDHRQLTYCYELLYQDWDWNINFLARDCEFVPHALITEAFTAPSPFSHETTITYRVEDNVLMSAKVYDLRGKLVSTIFENKEHPPGYHTVKYVIPDFASTGVYNIFLRAVPVDDPDVEYSQAVIKTQYIK
ncbi:MAG: hypothetical protein PF588_03120 [Candidatus Kapabacteria bacterium]|jgi:hypothetical protein|nr:hypothetical protein [Candidatus Kapabacteria bacterium]